MDTIFIYEITRGAGPASALGTLSDRPGSGLVLEDADTSPESAQALDALKKAVEAIRSSPGLPIAHESMEDGILRMRWENVSPGDPLYVFAAALALRREYGFGADWDDGEDEPEAGP